MQMSEQITQETSVELARNFLIMYPILYFCTTINVTNFSKSKGVFTLLRSKIRQGEIASSKR